VEYALLIALVAVVVTAVLLLLGPQIGNVFSGVGSSVSSESSPAPISSPAPSGSPTPSVTPTNGAIIGHLADFRQLIASYYSTNGRWPRSWGDYAFTDIGLNPADWSGAVDGIYWNPNGDKVGLANKSGDNLQIYVNDLNGNRLHLYDTWNIWCPAASASCYYHTVAPGNEVDISTISVVQQ
jgi:Flp pilus assembly pilin Flp